MINNKELNELEKAILKTVAFFDIFDYPLTMVEIYKWLYQPDRTYQLFDIIQALESESLKDKVTNKSGFYFLATRQSIIQTRLKRYQIAERKFRIALRTTWFLRWLAFIKMIAICNNAGYNNAAAESDIDFFIVVKKGRLWWSRLVIILVATLLGVRRHNRKIANRVCLSFYITDNRLNLLDISLKPIDPYLVYWFATLAPIYDGQVYQELFKVNNWLISHLPNFYPVILANRRKIKDNKYVRFSKKVDESILGEAFGDRLEKFARFIQLKKMKEKITKTASQNDTSVIISDSMLKFHENDKREIYRSLWQEKLNNLGIL